MKTIILTCIFFILSFSTDKVPETCYCTYDGQSWTAYCGYNEKITCKQCCKKTRPKPKKKKKKDE